MGVNPGEEKMYEKFIKPSELDKFKIEDGVSKMFYTYI